MDYRKIVTGYLIAGLGVFLLGDLLSITQFLGVWFVSTGAIYVKEGWNAEAHT